MKAPSFLSVAQWDRREEKCPEGATERCERDLLTLVLRVSNSNEIRQQTPIAVPRKGLHRVAHRFIQFQHLSHQAGYHCRLLGNVKELCGPRSFVPLVAQMLKTLRMLGRNIAERRCSWLLVLVR